MFCMQMQAGLSKKKQNGAAGGYLGWHRGGAADGGGAVVAVEGLRWPAELLLPLPLPPLFFFLLFSFSLQTILPSSFLFSFFLFFRPSPFFFSFLFFFCSFGPLPSPLVFSSSSVFFFSLSQFFVFSPSFSFFCVSFLPSTYWGEKEIYTPAQSMVQGCRVDGATTVQPPLYHPRDTSPPLTLTRGKLCRWRVPGRHLFGSSREGKVVRNRGEKIFFFPCFARPGEEEDPQCLQNGTVSAPFSSFFMNSV